MAEKQKEIDATTEATPTEPKKETDLEFETKVESIMARKLKEKEAELERKEQILNQKIGDFKEFVKNTELGGRASLIKELTEEEKKEQNTKDAANRIAASIGRTI